MQTEEREGGVGAGLLKAQGALRGVGEATVRIYSGKIFSSELSQDVYTPTSLRGDAMRIT